MRNVLIAIGNSGDPNLAETARGLLDDESDLVRAMAVWALARLADPATVQAEGRRRLPRETDEQVRREWAVELAA